MSQTDNALFIIEVILLLFGVPLMLDSFSNNVADVNGFLISCGLLILLCGLILYQGVWLDGFCN